MCFGFLWPSAWCVSVLPIYVKVSTIFETFCCSLVYSFKSSLLCRGSLRKKTEEPAIPRPSSLTRLQKRRNNRRPGHLIGGALTWDELLTSLTQGTISDPFASHVFTDRTTLRSGCQINEPLSLWECCSTGLGSHWPLLTKHTLYSASTLALEGGF